MENSLRGGLRGVRHALAWIGPAILLAGCASLTPVANVIRGTLTPPPGTGAVVILCDAKSGIPLNRYYRPFTETNDLDLLFVLSDAAGRFSFTNVPTGKYRVIAQSPIGPSERRSDGRAETFQLFGVADNTQVPSRRATGLRLAPPGTGAVTFDEGIPNNDAYLLISTRPTTGDPILGFLSWNENFVAHLIGVARLPDRRKLVVSGLPGTGVHISLFASDSAPGFGRVDFSRLPDTVQKIPIVAGWSDAQHEPPPRIRHVMEVLGQHATSAERILRYDPRRARIAEGPAAMLREAKSALGPLEREVVLPNGEKASVADLVATIGYTALQENDVQRARSMGRP